MTIIEEIRQNSGLLALPQSLSEILREMENQNFSVEKLAEIILRDPALTARILKLANSSFYHQVAEATTVHQAIQILGAVTVKCMALSSSVFNPEKFEKGTGINVIELFTSILTVAAASERIARECKLSSPEEALIAGLLHEIGTMFFIHHYPEQYKCIVDRTVQANSLLEAEKTVFGIDHAEAGYELALRWRVPKHISDAIADHHSPNISKKENKIRDIVRLACLLSNEGIEGYPIEMKSRIKRVDETAKALGLSEEQVESVTGSMLTMSLEVAEHMGVDIGSIEDMMARANQKLWRTYIMVENLFKERQELTEKVLQQERAEGAAESKNIAISTLSHYLNNAVMAAYGRSQLLRRQLDRGETEKLLERLPHSLDIIDHSVKKIVAVVAELKELSPLGEEVEFLNTSSAMNIDDRIEKRLKTMEKESGIVLPEVAEEALGNS